MNRAQDLRYLSLKSFPACIVPGVRICSYAVNFVHAKKASGAASYLKHMVAQEYKIIISDDTWLSICLNLTF